MRIYISLFLLTISFLSLAQENLQNYTPSILFDKGDWEFKTFQNTYIQKKKFEKNGFTKTAPSDKSQVYFSSINQLLYGVNSQINIGFDVWVNHTSLPNGGTRETQTGVALVGPKIKIAPFKSLERLSIQSSYLFKLGENLENRTLDPNDFELFFANDRSIWLTQFFYDLPLSEQFQLFFQQAFWYSIVDNSYRENNFLQSQTSVFASYFPSSRWTLYGMMEYFPTHYDATFGVQESKAFFSYFFQTGIGTKFQAVPNKLELEFLYTNFLIGSAGEGAGQTFNLGIRLINQ